MGVDIKNELGITMLKTTPKAAAMRVAAAIFHLPPQKIWKTSIKLISSSYVGRTSRITNPLNLPLQTFDWSGTPHQNQNDKDVVTLRLPYWIAYITEEEGFNHNVEYEIRWLATTLGRKANLVNDEQTTF